MSKTQPGIGKAPIGDTDPGSPPDMSAERPEQRRSAASELLDMPVGRMPVRVVERAASDGMSAVQYHGDAHHPPRQRLDHVTIPNAKVLVNVTQPPPPVGPTPEPVAGLRSTERMVDVPVEQAFLHERAQQQRYLPTGPRILSGAREPDGTEPGLPMPAADARPRGTRRSPALLALAAAVALLIGAISWLLSTHTSPSLPGAAPISPSASSSTVLSPPQASRRLADAPSTPWTPASAPVLAPRPTGAPPATAAPRLAASTGPRPVPVMPTSNASAVPSSRPSASAVPIPATAGTLFLPENL